MIRLTIPMILCIYVVCAVCMWNVSWGVFWMYLGMCFISLLYIWEKVDQLKKSKEGTHDES